MDSRPWAAQISFSRAQHIISTGLPVKSSAWKTALSDLKLHRSRFSLHHCVLSCIPEIRISYFGALLLPGLAAKCMVIAPSCTYQSSCTLLVFATCFWESYGFTCGCLWTSCYKLHFIYYFYYFGKPWKLYLYLGSYKKRKLFKATSHCDFTAGMYDQHEFDCDALTC